MNDSMKVIAMLFLIREREAQERKDYGVHNILGVLKEITQ